MTYAKQPLNILVVEDEATTAMHLRQVLEKAGHRVVAMVRTLHMAKQLSNKHVPDLAIIDIMLDKQSTGNGIETAKELLAQHTMPIIYLTANSEPEIVEAAKETLPAAYLLKPFRSEELVLHIDIAYHAFQARQLTQTSHILTGSLLIPVGKGHEKIEYDQVMYIEANGAYAKIVMSDKATHTVSTNLTQLAQYFQQPNFFRLSRFHHVNLNYFKRIKDDGLMMVDNQTILHLPENKRKEIMKKLTVVKTKPADTKHNTSM